MAQPNSPTPQSSGLYGMFINQATTSLLSNGLLGATPASVAETAQSVLHYSYSINGVPTTGDGLDQRYIGSTPNPSSFDLNGVTPPKYWDNRPR